MSDRSYPHRLEFRLRLGPASDDRAPGGAVTVALCGHWDHEGPCRWPHHSTIARDERALHHLLVRFDAPDDELDRVRARIHAALQAGRLTGPDGRESVWEIEG